MHASIRSATVLLFATLCCIAPSAAAHHTEAWQVGRAACMALPNVVPPPPPGAKPLPIPRTECLTKLGPMPSEPVRTISHGSPATVTQDGSVVQQIRGNEVLLPGDQMSRNNVRVHVEALSPSPGCLLPDCGRFRIRADGNAAVSEVAGPTTISHTLPGHQQKSTWRINVKPKRRMEDFRISFAVSMLAPPPGGTLGGLKTERKVWAADVAPAVGCSYTPRFVWEPENAVAAGCMANGECEAEIQWGQQTSQTLPPDTIKGSGKLLTQPFSISLNPQMPPGNWELECFTTFGHPEPLLSKSLAFSVQPGSVQTFRPRR